jgi:hypothetical protein
VTNETPTGRAAKEAALAHYKKVLDDAKKDSALGSDVHTPAELSEIIDKIAMNLAKRGMYEWAGDIKDAAKALCDLDEQLEEARFDIHRLKGQVGDLMDTLSSYCVVETVPATRETPAEYGVKRRDDDHDD